MPFFATLLRDISPNPSTTPSATRSISTTPPSITPTSSSIVMPPLHLHRPSSKRRPSIRGIFPSHANTSDKAYIDATRTPRYPTYLPPIPLVSREFVTLFDAPTDDIYRNESPSCPSLDGVDSTATDELKPTANADELKDTTNLQTRDDHIPPPSSPYLPHMETASHDSEHDRRLRIVTELATQFVAMHSQALTTFPGPPPTSVTKVCASPALADQSVLKGYGEKLVMAWRRKTSGRRIVRMT